MNKNSHKSRTSSDYGMKIKPLSKLKNRKTMTSKKFDNGVMLVIYDLLIFPFYSAGVKLSGSQIPDAESTIFIVMYTVFFG